MSGTDALNAAGEPLVRGRLRELSSFLGVCVELTKPSVTRMVVATTWCGAVIAPGKITDAPRLGWALLGTALIVGSANALNMFLEGDVDALMARTRGRPIPSGRTTPEGALWFGPVLAFPGLPGPEYLV